MSQASNCIGIPLFLHPLKQFRITEKCPDGGIGRRVGLKHQYRKMCRFDPGSGYIKAAFLGCFFIFTYWRSCFDLILGVGLKYQFRKMFRSDSYRNDPGSGYIKAAFLG